MFSLFHAPFLVSSKSVFINSNICWGHSCASFWVCIDIPNTHVLFLRDFQSMGKEKCSISKGINHSINAYYKTCFNSRKTSFYVRGRAYLGLSSHKNTLWRGYLNWDRQFGDCQAKNWKKNDSNRRNSKDKGLEDRTNCYIWKSIRITP